MIDDIIACPWSFTHHPTLLGSPSSPHGEEDNKDNVGPENWGTHTRQPSEARVQVHWEVV